MRARIILYANPVNRISPAEIYFLGIDRRKHGLALLTQVSRGSESHLIGIGLESLKYAVCHLLRGHYKVAFIRAAAPSGEFGCNDGRRYFEDAHASISKLVSKRQAEGVDCRLGGAINRYSGQWRESQAG